MDGLIDWNELIPVLEPLLGKYWQAELSGANEYDQWAQLHWETHSTITRTKDGYTKKGEKFWVNKLTGESSWTIPAILERHVSIEEKRKARSLSAPPTLAKVLQDTFTRNSASANSLTPAEYWRILRSDLNLMGTLSEADIASLIEKSDLNADGVKSMSEFVSAISPLLQGIFHDRKDNDTWVALSTVEEGEEYLYWYNRTTGESGWTPPIRQFT
jgi:hypothetical protein